jgi:hypothetical protein
VRPVRKSSIGAIGLSLIEGQAIDSHGSSLNLNVRASSPLKSDIGEVADAGGVGVVAVAEHGDIDQVRGRRILPDLGIDAGKVDPLVKPAADPIVAGVGNKVREIADVFRVSPVSADCPRSPPWRPSHRDRL